MPASSSGSGSEVLSLKSAIIGAAVWASSKARCVLVVSAQLHGDRERHRGIAHMVKLAKLSLRGRWA